MNDVNRLIAENVMGWVSLDSGEWINADGSILRPQNEWNPVEDANDALEVVEHLNGEGISFTVRRSGVSLKEELWWVEFAKGGRGHGAQGSTFAKVVCHGALLVKSVPMNVILTLYANNKL